MNTSAPLDLLLLATKGTVLAFNRETGARVWETSLSSWNGDYVTLLADQTRVFAHSKGTLYCLDLRTGRILWDDGLAGLGYGLASLALPGVASSSDAANAAEHLRRLKSANSSSPGAPGH